MLGTVGETTAEIVETAVETVETTVAAEGKHSEKKIANIVKKHAMLADKGRYSSVNGGDKKGA